MGVRPPMSDKCSAEPKGFINDKLATLAGRTKQHRCPIKHALRIKTMHSRYQYFLDYGDAVEYRDSAK
jgi:hypothetical protein